MRFGRVNGGGGLGARGRRRQDDERGWGEEHGEPALLCLKLDTSRRPALVSPPMAPPSVLNPPQASQKDLLARFLRPRQAADLVLSLDLDQDYIDIRHTTIEDLEAGGRLVLAQSDPPLLRSHRGQPVEVSFLYRERGPGGAQWQRLGYRTRVADVVPNYRLRAGVLITAILVDPPRRLEPSTVRMAPRLPPSPDMDLQLFLQPHRVEVTILDLSAGGVCFSHEAWMGFDRGSRVRLGLATGGLWLDLVGDVVRVEPMGTQRSATAVRFENLEMRDRRLIRQLTLEINRHLHSQRLESRGGPARPAGAAGAGR